MPARVIFPLFLLPILLVGCGGGGGAGTPDSQQQQHPAGNPVAKGELVTLIGSRESQGLHWILVGDGFTATQQDDLRAAALSLGEQLLDTPEIAAHTSVWNVHVLQVASAQSGVDDAAAGQLVDTAFDGALGCGSNSRVACVDWSGIHDALLAVQAPQAQLTVILNTPLYVGSSNSSGIVVSRNAHAPRIAVHELGHRVAGLADEYVDNVVASELLPYYIEGRFPNVTTQALAQQAPWRHWLDDTGAGVGLFEGAYYVASGFYRAKQDSLMRTLEAPLGQVNAEAWLRAQYRALPPVSGTSPEAQSVRGLAGDTVEFSVVSEWPRDVVELRWFVDGVEAAAARDCDSFRLAADGGTHLVEVRARDISGRIRAPDALEASMSRAWTVSPTVAPAVTKVQTTPASVEWLKMRVDAAGHQVLGRQASAPQGPTGLVQGPDSHLRYTLLDDAGAAVASGDLPDPRVARSTLSAPGEPHAGHGTVLLESGIYYVGIPQGTAVRKLRIAVTAAGTEKLAGTGLPPAGAIELTLDAP